MSHEVYSGLRGVASVVVAVAGAVGIGVVTAAGIAVVFIFFVEEVVYSGTNSDAFYVGQPEGVCDAQVAHEVGIEAVLLLSAVAHVLLACVLGLQFNVNALETVTYGVV